jgi:hypothetical protein
MRSKLARSGKNDRCSAIRRRAESVRKKFLRELRTSVVHSFLKFNPETQRGQGRHQDTFKLTERKPRRTKFHSSSNSVKIMRRGLIRVGLIFLALLLAASPSLAQSRPYTPDKGSAERKAITDALRVPVEKKLKQQVIFKIDHLKVQSGWAFLLGAPRRTDGSQIDYRDTPYADAYKAGMFGDDVMGLLHKVGGQWRVVQYVIGATDVAYFGWDRKYRAPSAIFPH